jgi:DNA polymerase-3 subunit gamma/tau
MTYQVLARKWRPRTFAEVIGQQHVVTALENALAEGRIAQAYLFSGIRGVGKTSVARIFARALNGREATPGTPDESPIEADLDILEVDAATYSKVEQVRELVETLRYKPVHGRYKVVVLDEVHRLSRQAFDALLRIVEEPPPHLVFIFATTEVEQVPATILSRCQEFTFHRVAFGRLADHLRQLAEAEEITVSSRALAAIARAAEGSVRDAVALLDQLATYGSGTIAEEDASRLSGGVAAEVHHRLLAAILGGEGSSASAVAAEIESEGRDPRHVYGQFLGYCRDALHMALGAAGAGAEMPGEEAGAVTELARRAGYENLLRIIHLLLGSEETVRRSEAGMLAAEIAWLRAAELPKLTAIERLLSGGEPVRAPAPPPQPTALSPGPAPHGDDLVDPPAAAPIPLPPRATPPPAEVEAFRSLLSRYRASLAAQVESLAQLEFAHGVLTLHVPAGDTLLSRALTRETNRETFARSVAEVWGPGASWRIVEGERPKPALAVAAGDPVLAHPTVQAALDIFGGTVESIEPAPHSEES